MRSFFHGDNICKLVVKVMVENERSEHILLSLHDDDPLNFLWKRFIHENLVTVIHDRWDKTCKHQQYEIFGQRRNSRIVKGISVDIYKELYPRLDGGDRQHILCGEERGLGRRNIFEYYYYGQESFIEHPTGTTTFGDDIIDVPDVQRLTSRSVFLAPHEKCQHSNQRKRFRLKVGCHVAMRVLISLPRYAFYEAEA